MSAVAPNLSVRKIRSLLLVAGRRVNLLLALLPSALQIDPPPGSGAFPSRICARRSDSNQKGISLERD